MTPVNDKNINKSRQTRIEQARVYEAEMRCFIDAARRPEIHMSSPVGWINDPNGFSVYKGMYHLFFQYHPNSIFWGPMHWGHCISEDLISWEYKPVALAPDQLYDAQGCFSGSAIEDGSSHVLMYTGVMEEKIPGGKSKIRQVQCIAVGDGENYEKIPENPVIIEEQLPEGSNREDFRDPKIWKESDGYYAVIGSRHEDGSGQILLYHSDNLKEWQRVDTIARCRNEYGRMWECPDFFNLDGKDVLIVSPQEMEAEGLEFHNGNGVLFISGEYDWKQRCFRREHLSAVDYGLDFYAPQTLETRDGKRIMIAWMQSWDNHIVPEQLGWSGMMTIPRELHIIAGRLYQNPVKELERYRCEPVFIKGARISGRTRFGGIAGREADLTVEVTGGEFQSFSIAVAADEHYCTMISYFPGRGILRFDRTDSGLRRDVIMMREMEVSERDGRLKLRIILDKYSAEIFVNDGEKVMTSTFYTPLAAADILFEAEGTAECSIEKYRLRKLIQNT